MTAQVTTPLTASAVAALASCNPVRAERASTTSRGAPVRRFSLDGSMHDPTDPVGRLLFNVLAMVAVISSSSADQAPDLGLRVEDGVFDTAA